MDSKNNTLITNQQLKDLRRLLNDLRLTIESDKFTPIKNFQCFGSKQTIVVNILAIQNITYDVGNFIEMAELDKN